MTQAAAVPGVLVMRCYEPHGGSLPGCRPLPHTFDVTRPPTAPVGPRPLHLDAGKSMGVCGPPGPPSGLCGPVKPPVRDRQPPVRDPNRLNRRSVRPTSPGANPPPPGPRPHPFRRLVPRKTRAQTRPTPTTSTPFGPAASSTQRMTSPPVPNDVL